MFNGLNHKALFCNANLFLLTTILFVSPSISALEADPAASTDVEFAIFTLNSELPPLSKSKARMLYRGKSKNCAG